VRKAVSGVMLSLLLIGMLTLTAKIQPAKAAAAAVYIRADGSVYPSTAPMERNGSIYTLTGNITTDCDGIWIERSNVILDGAGYTVQGPGGLGTSGIYFRGRSNVAIRNIGVKQFSIGIDISESSGNSISGSTITDSGNYGIWLKSSNNNIKDNIIANNYYGFYLDKSSNNSISGNNIAASLCDGIWLSYRCSYNTIVGNNIIGNEGHGIELYDSSYNNISENVITANSYDGITIGSSSDNSIVGNNITENYMIGIRVFYSKYSSISGNYIANNWAGIGFFRSSYISIVGNSVTGNHEYGVWLYDGSSDNLVCGNNIANNKYGFSLDSSSNNAFYHNNVLDNAQQVSTYNSINVWDDGYPSGGNYWSDYAEGDSNNDGIGDTPYVIDADNRDRYPHMKAVVSTVYLASSAIITEAGKTFNVNIMVPRAQNLWAWQAGIQWNPDVLEYVSCMWGEFQTIAGASKRSLPIIDSASGKTSKPALEGALRGWFAPVSAADMKLLIITFKAIKTGASSLRLIDVSLRGQNSTSTTAYSRWSDVNGDGAVGTEDTNLTYTCWEEGYYNQAVDFNDDGIVDITDISIVTSDFGKCDTDPEWDVTNTIYDIPTATVGANVQVLPSEAYISVPYHSQQKGYSCGPAALRMLFDFYGPDVPEIEIRDVARTSSYGTFTCDMIRAPHFSNLSTSVGKESSLNYTGYSTRKLGYAAFERGGMTIDDLKSLIIAGYPIIVLTTWHFRVVVGYSSTQITFQDSYYGPLTNMTYSAFSTDWDYSGHWGLLVSPWNVKVSNVRNVLPGDVFNVTATITYPWAPPFPKDQYPASMANVTITLPEGLTLVSGETAKKIIGTGYLAAGESVNVTWTVQATSLGNGIISAEAEGKVAGWMPPVPPNYPEYSYEDRIGGLGQSIVAVTSNLDVSPPVTVDDYDGLWHNQNFGIDLAAQDDLCGVMETYYRINDGPVKTLSLDGQPYITTSGANSTLEYWSVDWAGNEEFPHKFMFEIKLDNTSPTIGVPLRTPSGDIQPSQEVKVTVHVTDVVTGVKNVTLSYTVTNGIIWKTLTMNYNISTSLYEATIPGQPDGTLVIFRIIAYDNIGNRAVEDNFGRYYIYQVQATYELTITTTSGGTTNPPPDTYIYRSGIVVSITAIPNHGYLFDHWELDDVNVGSTNPYKVLMDKNHTLKAVFLYIPPLSASISPLSASIKKGDSVTFTSTVTGGIQPYYYQWYLDGNPVSDAISDSWTFTSTKSGLYYVRLEVTDTEFNIVQSETSRITVTTAPVGGHSFPIEGQTTANPLTLYLVVTAILAAVFTVFRRKRPSKIDQRIIFMTRFMYDYASRV